MNLVLVHGILGFRERLGIEYFRGITEPVEEAGLKVLALELNPTAGIKVRGEPLRSQIVAAFNTGVLDPDQPTHIIAHSMGGLDSRFMLPPKNENITTQNDLLGRSHRSTWLCH